MQPGDVKLGGLTPAPTSGSAWAPGTVGRYALHDRIASGGMASVHLGRLRGEGGFARIVAIKRMHPHLCQAPSFVSMFLDEARLAARIRHPNVVPTLDVVAAGDEMLLVMEYVPGESLARLLGTLATRGDRLPPRIASAIVCGTLHGLHAAHEATDERGDPLYIVHRDVSPQNILVGADGVVRLLDFGVAKAISRLSETRDGEIKGKLAYMAPEQFSDRTVDRRADVYAAGVVLWEALVGARLHGNASEAATVERVLYGTVEPPTSRVPSLPPGIDAVVMRALAKDPDQRTATARELAEAVEAELGTASMGEVRAWVEDVAGERLALRADLVLSVEQSVDLTGPVRRAGPLEDLQIPVDTDAVASPDVTFTETAVDPPRGRRRGWVPALTLAAVIAAASAAVPAFFTRSPTKLGMPTAPAGTTTPPSEVPPSASSTPPQPSPSASAEVPRASEGTSLAIPTASATPHPVAAPARRAAKPGGRAGAETIPRAFPRDLPSDRE